MYSSSAWAPATEKITTQKKLRTVQRGFAQKICKSYRTVSFNAAVVLAGLIPLDARIREATQLYDIKRGKPQTILPNREIEDRVCFLSAPHPSKEPNIEFTCLEDMEESTIVTHEIKGLNVFTDGSKTEHGVGAALTCWKDREEMDKKKFRLEAYCTVFQAELFALYQATEYAVKTNENRVNIFSDSRSSLELLKNIQVLHPLGFAIKNNLIKLEETGKQVKLFWIRAHVGVPGNERADMLAKEAANMVSTSLEYDKCPVSYMKRVIRQNTLNLWNKNYIEGETASTTKVYFPTVELAYRFVREVNLTPVLVQAMTGHGGFAAYLYKFKCKDSPECVCDRDQQETALHAIVECPRFGGAREDLQQIIKIKLTLQSIPEIIMNRKIRKRFLNFCTYVVNKTLDRNKTR